MNQIMMKLMREKQQLHIAEQSYKKKYSEAAFAVLAALGLDGKVVLNVKAFKQRYGWQRNWIDKMPDVFCTGMIRLYETGDIYRPYAPMFVSEKGSLGESFSWAFDDECFKDYNADDMLNVWKQALTPFFHAYCEKGKSA